MITSEDNNKAGHSEQNGTKKVRKLWLKKYKEKWKTNKVTIRREQDTEKTRKRTIIIIIVIIIIVIVIFIRQRQVRIKQK